MKKIFATLVLVVMTMAASAQIKSVDIKGDLRGDFGLGAGITAGLFDKVDFAPSFNYYFCDGDATCWTIDADFHYNFNVAQDFQIYPLVGASLCHWGIKDASSTKVGVNLGAGVKYAITNNVGIFAECKYQWVDGNDDTFAAIGVNIGI